MQTTKSDGRIIEAREYSANADAIREHLAAVLASKPFASTPRLRHFLTFIVEKALAGEAQQLKEYVVATDVYGRDVTYDPQVDSTVRVEASRLRSRLRDFYAIAAGEGAMEIRLPKGGYAPVFVRHADAAPVPVVVRAATAGRSLAWTAVAGAFVLAMMLWQLAPAMRGAQTDFPPAAMEQYLRAQKLLRAPVLQNGWPGATPQPVLDSIRLFEEVTAAHPGFARAWVGLAEAQEWAYELDKQRPAMRIERARAALDRAIAVEPQLADAWSRLSSVYFHRLGNLGEAERAARRAVELNPRDIASAGRLVDLLRIQGDFPQALDVLARTLATEPAAAKVWVQRALVLYDLGRYEEALGIADHALGLFAGKHHPTAWWARGLCLERLGRTAEAEAAYRAGMAPHSIEAWNAPSLGYLLARTGRTAEARAILANLVRQHENGMGIAYQIALIHTGLAEIDQALSWLERGLAAGDTTIPYLRLEKRFERLQGNPRFAAIAARWTPPAS